VLIGFDESPYGRDGCRGQRIFENKSRRLRARLAPKTPQRDSKHVCASHTQMGDGDGPTEAIPASAVMKKIGIALYGVDQTSWMTRDWGGYRRRACSASAYPDGEAPIATTRRPSENTRNGLR
jgi:hypothetical protein